MIYGFKEVPDLFFCVKDTKNIHFALTHLTKFSYEKYGDQYYFKITDKFFNPVILSTIEDWLSNYDMYFRSYKRRKDTGKDESFCIKFEGLELNRVYFDCAVDGDPSEFIYEISAQSKTLLEDEDCPQRTEDDYDF